jgi:chemotaxis protein CheZ
VQAQKQHFTIEGSAETALTAVPQAVPLAHLDASPASTGTLSDVLQRLDHFAKQLEPAQTVISNIADAYRREVVEVTKLREEMSSIQVAIHETKMQVVSLHTVEAKVVAVPHAAGELNAVVFDTESATNKILAAAETIEMLAGTVQSEQTPQLKNRRAQEIAAQVAVIYEACNFQDITGQRIQRVCDTLNYVESRISRMAEVWGGLDHLAGLMSSEIKSMESKQAMLGTHGLANGPKLASQADGHVDQLAIDALFD